MNTYAARLLVKVASKPTVVVALAFVAAAIAAGFFDGPG
jgi:hypothetical protein